MKKISEMSQDELRDYALVLEGEKKTLTEQLTAKDGEIAQLNADNATLLRRNNALFLQVEQQSAPQEAQKEQPPQPVESCEDFAKNLVNNRRF